MSCTSAQLSERIPADGGRESERVRERERGKVGQMDFFAGFRPLLFSYVLINGILITLQTKEGTLPVFSYLLNLYNVLKLV